MNERASAAPTAQAVLADPATSDWVRRSLPLALARDPVDALHDALLLAAVLDERLRVELGMDDPP